MENEDMVDPADVFSQEKQEIEEEVK